MHVIQLLASDLFEVRLGGCESSRHAIFPAWSAADRFGLVIDEPLGGLGACHLIQLASVMFYDVKPSRRTDRKVYPEIYALHYGRGYGAHAPFDFWPARREAILDADPRILLDAINDRGITRLAIPDRPRREIDHRPKEEDAALDRAARRPPRSRRPTLCITNGSSSAEPTSARRMSSAPSAGGKPCATIRASRRKAIVSWTWQKP